MPPAVAVPSAGGASAAVGNRELVLERGVLVAKALVVGAQRVGALAQRRVACALAGRDGAGDGGLVLAEAFDLGA
ncbi:MAG: hypothetical protein ACR2ML_12300 [Solirubrobacteraceae bacterium]